MYGLAGGFGIGLPPVMHFGSEEFKARIVGPCLRGEKRICLAITEVSTSPFSLPRRRSLLRLVLHLVADSPARLLVPSMNRNADSFPCSRVEDQMSLPSPPPRSRLLMASITSSTERRSTSHAQRITFSRC